MSVPTPILSSAVPFAISSNLGVTYKNVVCKKTWGYTGAATLAEEETDCGVLTGVGAIKDSFNFEFVLNTTPNGATEWGSNDVMNFFQARTLLYVKVTNGATYIRTLAGYISNYTETAAQGGMINATGTFNGTGTLTTV
jgi:hypothetical protein